MDAASLCDESTLLKLSCFPSGKTTLDLVVIADFYLSSLSQIKDLRRASENGSFADVAFTAHAMKSTTLTLGLGPLSEILEQIELRAEDLKETQSLLKEMSRLYLNSLKALAAYETRIGSRTNASDQPKTDPQDET